MYQRIGFAFALVCLAALRAMAQTPVTTIVNPDFEVGTPGTVVGSPWVQIGGLDPMYISTGSGLSAGSATSPFSGSQFLTADRFANPADTSGANNRGVYQNVDLSPYATLINMGGRQMDLSFAYNDNDSNDTAVVAYNFLDGVGSSIGNTYTFTAPNTATGNWATTSLMGDIPVGASSMHLELRTAFTSGTVRNVSYDSLGAQILPPAPPPPPSGIVHGNLIQFDSDGAWTWYSDERAVVDPNNGHVLVNSVGYSPTVGGSSPGNVDVVNFNPTTGSRVRTRLSNQVPGNPQIQTDDHNVGALLVLPDGRYLAMYANHGNNGGLGDEFSRFRVSNNPGDSTSWSTEKLFNWYNAVPGANQTGNPDAANVAYHNLFYLSAENQVYDISRSYGRLSSNGASQNMPNIARYNIDTNTVSWAGQLLESAAQGYSAYPKYASNGVDRIYFTSTETHPRDYNNSIFSGYIQNGKTYDMLGNVVDNNIFDNGTAAGGSGFVSDVTDFTLVEQSDPLGQGHNRLWTVDLNLDASGDPMALYISRWNPDGSTSAGSTTNPIDHRLHFAHWNSQSNQWNTHEIARMGNRLYRLPSDMSEQDYTGNAALVPGDPNTVYISTPYDPRDPSGATFTTSYEIYKGVTQDGGANWSWKAITEHSVVDNLRPIVPDSHGGDTTVLWFRGRYSTAQSIDAAVVGIVDRSGEVQSLVNYVDANTSNTKYASGAALQTSTPSASAGPLDNLWHERTGSGNGGSVLTSSETGFENAPMLKTTIAGSTLEDGTYDVFAYFWSHVDEDWRVMAGLDNNNLIDFRRYGSQLAEADQFASIETVSADNNGIQLYRAYLGRVQVANGADIDVFIDDWQSTVGSAIRTWYDGVGYALITDVVHGLAGDFNGDMIVDAADYTVWRDHLGTNFDLNGNGDEAGDSQGLVDQADYDLWKANFGNTPSGSGAANLAVPEPAAIWLLFAASTLMLSSRQRLKSIRVRHTS
jgi:BNR repeat-containing family member